MASNNSQGQWQQGWIRKGGGRKQDASSPAHQSEIDVNSRKQQGVIHKLQDMFIDVLDLEVIQSVAQNCEFNRK
jgi:hypothetical protein